MNNTMKAGIFAAVVVLFASLAMLAVPVSAEGETDDTATVEIKEMTAENFLLLAKDGKIVMDSDVKLTSALVISGTIELDLNGHKLVNETAHTLKVDKGGKLTVKGAGTVDCIKDDTAALYVDAGGEAILNGGTFMRSAETGSAPNAHGTNSWYTIANRGTMTINDGVAVQNGDAKTTGRFSSMIGNGYPTATDNEDGHDVTLTINGGRFVGGLYNIKNDDYGVLTINGGTFVASSGLCNILTWNDLTVKGGQFSSGVGIINAWDTSAAYNKGILNISGGTFDCPDRIVYLGMESNSTYTLDMAFDGLKEGRSVLKTASGIIMDGTISVNKNVVELKAITAGAGFSLAVGSIDIEGAYTSAADGSIIVSGDAKLSGTIDPTVTVKVESGSITVPAGKALTGTIQMGEKNSVTLSGITAGDNGFTVTPTTIGGDATAGSIVVGGTVSVASALKLGKDVTVTVPEKSELSVPKGVSVSGGKIVNAGAVVVDGTVESTIANSGRVSAAVDAKVSDVEGDGDFDQVKPVIERKVFDANVPVGGRVTFAVTVTDGASVKLTGVDWATYKDGMISGTPTKAGEYKITATPFIGDNIGKSIVFSVNVYESTDNVDPVDPVEPEKEKKGGFSAATILIIVILIALAVFAVTRFI